MFALNKLKKCFVEVYVVLFLQEVLSWKEMRRSEWKRWTDLTQPSQKTHRDPRIPYRSMFLSPELMKTPACDCERDVKIWHSRLRILMGIPCPSLFPSPAELMKTDPKDDCKRFGWSSYLGPTLCREDKVCDSSYICHLWQSTVWLTPMK